MKSTKANRQQSRPATHPATSSSTGAAADHYRREKARRAKQRPSESEAMAAAKREYQALLEADAAKGKGGRPKKKPARPKTDPVDLDLPDAEEDVADE